ncbi:MAG TPA: DMT family transporter, partial [Desulfitobacterium dehalogenans]|nr:DMT family transporter [Desulfitobacterium dehalogenans]
MEPKKTSAIFFAVLAALLFGISSPVSKLLLAEISPTMMAALLYLGAGLGMCVVRLFNHTQGSEVKEARITQKDFPYVLAMIVLDIAAPVFLMVGLALSSAAHASLLGNFEIVATSLIALLIFKESIGKRLWAALALITLSSIILSVEDLSNFTFSLGSIFVLLSCICWGFENNCTRKLSIKDPMDIVILKGLGSGIGALALALLLKEGFSSIVYSLCALLLGFVAYGLSIFFYVRAQRELGAARTSAYYALAPFIGVGLSFGIFREIPTPSFLIALGIMIAGAYLASSEDHEHLHEHPALTHEHRHSHKDHHHNHPHPDSF